MLLIWGYQCKVLATPADKIALYIIQIVWSIYLIPEIDDLHISHNASGMEANIRVLLIHNSSSHSSLDVNDLELTLCFTRLRNQGNSLMRNWY